MDTNCRAKLSKLLGDTARYHVKKGRAGQPCATSLHDHNENSITLLHQYTPSEEGEKEIFTYFTIRTDENNNFFARITSRDRSLKFFCNQEVAAEFDRIKAAWDGIMKTEGNTKVDTTSILEKLLISVD